MIPLAFLAGLVTMVQAQEISFKDHGQVVRTLQLSELKKQGLHEQVKVLDHNEKTEITYEVLALKPLLDKIYGGKWHKAEELLLTCTDGYQPSVPLEALNRGQAYLAYARIGSEKFTLTNKTERGRLVDLGPLYLIWKNPDEPAWPYQLVAFDLVQFADRFGAVAPPAKASAQAQRGFVAFRTYCLSCHSLNGTGGKGGPELNYPVNVTEYYKMEFLKKWIAQPTSIRASSPMPGFKDIANSDAVIDTIVEYLKVMRTKKIAPATSR